MTLDRKSHSPLITRNAVSAFAAMRRARNAMLGAAAVLLAFACDESEPNADAESEKDAGPRVAEHAYALQTMVYQPDESVMSYVALSDTLDISEVSTKRAREFASYAFITAVGGKLLVSAGEEPTITQYEITDDLEWDERESLSFAGEGVTGGGAGFERHWLLNEHAAYLTLDVTSRIVWDPTSFRILDVMEDSALEAESEGLTLDATFNRPPQLLQGPVLKPFYYRDNDWFLFGTNTAIAVYDEETHEERAVLDVPCPALEVASQDEDGNTYFSPWTYGPTLSLFGEGPAPCIRRIASDSTLDEDWAPDLTQWTDGRPVMVFRYMRNGKALGTVLHVEEVEGDFTAGYDPELAEELDDHYRLWLFDLEAETAAPVAGVGSLSSGFNWANLDGRTFVFVPDSEWTSTTVYELEESGDATERFEVDGLVNNWVKVR